MEYVLQNTDLFDEEIGTKFHETLKTEMEKFDKEKVYKLTVSFHVNLLDDPRIESFYIPEPSITNKGTEKDQMYDVLKTQLKTLVQVLDKYELESDSHTIQGDDLEAEDIIIIKIEEDTREQKFVGKGKNRRRVKAKVNSIVPSRPGTQELVSKLYSERIVKIYKDFFMPIRKDKKIMSEILGIEETEDEAILVNAFAKQYGDLWLTTNEKEKELVNRLKERTLFVLNKYLAEEKQIDNSSKMDDTE